MVNAVRLVDTFTIGEVAKDVGLTPRAIRYYERIGLMHAPSRNRHNYRLYGQEALSELRFIAHCRALGLSAAEIRTLRTGATEGTKGRARAAAVREQLRLTEARIRELFSLRRELRRQLGLRHADDSGRPVTTTDLAIGIKTCASRR